jgi:nitroreductase
LAAASNSLGVGTQSSSLNSDPTDQCNADNLLDISKGAGETRAVDVREALRTRRMTRAFDGTEVPEATLTDLCEEAMRAPTAGHARGVDVAVLAGTVGVRRYLDEATDATWRATSPRAAGLSAAGGAVVVACRPERYAARYAASDKARSGLGEVERWPVPYWFGDAGAFTMALLLLAEAEGHAACFLGAFRRHREVLDALGAPSDAVLFGAVLVGTPLLTQTRSSSLERPGPSRAARVGRGQFPSS